MMGGMGQLCLWSSWMRKNCLFLWMILLALQMQINLIEGYSECNEQLIASSKLRASSQLNKERSPDKAVRDSGSSWTAGVSDFGQYLEVSIHSHFHHHCFYSIQFNASSHVYVHTFRWI